jgi:hypothetical protein
MSHYSSLHHSISRDPQRLPKCCICGDPVCLETSKTDEYGQALHEECYVLKLWLNTDFLHVGETYAGPRPTSKRTATFATQRWHTSGSLPYQKARRVCDMFIQRAKLGSWHAWPWKLELAAVVTVLLLTCWIAFGDVHPASFLKRLGLQKSTALEAQVLVPGKAVRGKVRSKPLTVSVPTRKARIGKVLQPVGETENEVVEIGDDVTVRYFTTKPRRTAAGSSREVSSRSVGEDVTVRYFRLTSRRASN